MTKPDDAVAALKYDSAGLIPAIIVDAADGGVLMMAWMNAESLRATIATGRTHFWSRSRGKQWMKGEESGHTQQVKAIYTDCDKDTLVIEVVQKGAACHDGYRSCFYRRLDAEGDWQVVGRKLFDPESVYGKRP